MKSKRSQFIVRLIVGLAALGLLLSRFSARQVIAGFTGVKWPIFAAVIGVGFVGVMVSAYKWQILAQGHGQSVRYRLLVRWYMEGIFFNNFLPTSIGGDVHRAYQLGKHTEEQAISAATVIVERMSGFLALAIFAAVGVALDADLRETIPGLAAAVVLICGVGILLVAMALSPAVAGLTVRALSRVGLKGLAPKVEKLAWSINEYRKQPQALAAVLLLSLVFNGLLVLSYYLLVLATGAAAVSPVALSGTIPVVTLVAALPISVNGLGLQEGSLVFALGRLGVPAAAALTVALLSRLGTLVLAVVGAIMWMLLDRPAALRAAEQTGSGSPE